MDKKISFGNRIFSLFLSLLLIVTLLLSFFTFPIELVLFNAQSYKPVLENEENLTRYPEIVSELFTYQLFGGVSGTQIPKLFSNRELLRTDIENYIPSDWALASFETLTSHILNYFNFRIPDSSIKLDISQLKSELILNSNEITSDYFAALPRCSEASTNLEAFASDDTPDVFLLPPCRPSVELLPKFTNSAAIYIEDSINRLPGEVSVTGIMPLDNNWANRFFYFYSLGRWALRLLPILAISILILIAFLLRSERKVMLGWIGRLLVFTSGFGLIGLIILFIGFDQFVVMMLNPFINQMIEGFGAMLLGLIQKVGYTTLVWVILSEILVLIFGLFLLLVNKLIKPKTITGEEAKIEEKDNESVEVIENVDTEEINTQKEIIPETLEEIESREKKTSKRKKTGNQKP